MTTLLVSHSDCLYHDTSPGHPESPDRLRAVMRALAAEEFAPLLREEAPSATDAQLLRVHPPEVLRRLAAKVDEMHAAEARGDYDAAERDRKAVTRLDCAATKAYRAWDDAARVTRTAWTH